MSLITWCASQLYLYELPKYWSGFLLQSGRLIQVKTIGTARRDLAEGDRDRLIEGDRLIQGRLIQVRL